jgi:hypothetical protein
MEIDRLREAEGGGSVAMQTAESEVLRLEERLGNWRETLGGEPEPAGAARDHDDRNEAFFELESFRERMRARARELGIGLRHDEQFGFASHLREGPDPDARTAVLRQRQLIERLMTALFREPPAHFRGVQRERPAITGLAGPVTKGARMAGRAEAGEFFELDPGVSARVPGLIDSTAARIVFTGRTDTLRSFLNGISVLEIPLIVRMVEVERADQRDTPAVTVAGEDQVELSQFTVVVEQVWLTAAVARPAREGAGKEP